MKKISAVAIAFALCAVMLTGCGENNDNDSISGANGRGDDTADTLSEVMSDAGNAVGNVVSDAGDAAGDVGDTVSEIIDDLGDDDNSGENKATAANASLSAADIETLENQTKGWGQGTSVDDLNRPTACTSYQEKYGKYDAYFIMPNTNAIYLTFDEGYENGYTSKILDILKEKNCPAVFFVTMDYVKKNPDLVKRMINEGHIVGNHSTTHPSMPSVSISGATNEIMELHNYVKDNFGYEMTLFRPPMGEWSERTLALTQSLGYKSVFWSFAYKDWVTSEQPEVTSALTKTTSCAHNGAIYLLHAVSSTNTTILSDFIDNVRSKGYVFTKMS